MSITEHRLGEYVLLGNAFAEGGTASVYRGQKRGGGPLVCVKRMERRMDDDEEIAASFMAEAEFATALDHPNIVRVHEWGSDESSYYIVMELVRGTDLATILAKNGPLAPDLVAYVGLSLARALVYIHHRGAAHPPLIHCDVTPHNVLVADTGAVKLSDFGVARALRTTGAATITRERGKAAYLAPEQLDPEARVSSSVDLFALGLVLWQGLIGSHPYFEGCPPGRSLRRWIPAQLRKNARRRVVEAAPGAPVGLCQAIEALLQPVSARTPRAEDVLDALQPHVKPNSAPTLGELAAPLAPKHDDFD